MYIAIDDSIWDLELQNFWYEYKANSIHRIPLFNIGTIGISDLQFDLPCTKPFLFDQVS